MAINVNRVTLGRNKFFDTTYFTSIASCPVSSTPFADGSFLICKEGGVAWFVAPNSTQFISEWANGQYNNTLVGDKCCISEWGVLGSCLSSVGYISTEWFIPTKAQIQNPGYCCRVNWGDTSSNYWTSTETVAACACLVSFITANVGGGYTNVKSCPFSVRAFRCVTY